MASKGLEYFSGADAPVMDFIITVCDNAAGELCPYWPGQPATAHWGYADPSEVAGGEEKQREAFMHTLHLIRRRLEILVNLPDTSLNKLTLEKTARDLSSQ